MEAMEYVTKDGTITLTVTFNTEQDEYSPETIGEIIQVLQATAESLRFGLEHPEFKDLGPGNDS